MKTDNRNKWQLYLLPFISMLFITTTGIMFQDNRREIALLSTLIIILTSIATFYIHWNRERLIRDTRTIYLIVCLYLISICLLVLVPNSEHHLFWMVGGLIVAMQVDIKLGLIYQFNMIILIALRNNLGVEVLIQLLIIGVVMSLLSGYLKEKQTVIYSSIIVLSLDITLSFVMKQFTYEMGEVMNYLSGTISILIVLIVAFLFYYLYRDKNQVEEAEPVIGECAAIEVAATMDDGYIVASRTSYEVLNEETNGLMMSLKEYSETQYQHGILIGDLSYRAAQLIGVNANLAKAAGLYHDIGLIKGNNTIESTLSIASDYAFPRELIELLRQQHNMKYDKPITVEGLIVMLSDKVVKTIAYIQKKTDQKFTSSRIVEYIFKKALEKGTFDQTGLSVKDYNKLKSFYQSEYEKLII